MSSPTHPNSDDCSQLLLQDRPSNSQSANSIATPTGSASTVKITPWRVLNSVVILSFGTTKAILAFNDNPRADAFDMALGLVWAFIAYWGCIFEAECPGIAPWLFAVDISQLVSSVLHLLGIIPVVLLLLVLIECALAIKSHISSPVIQWLVIIPSTIVFGLVISVLGMVSWHLYRVLRARVIWRRFTKRLGPPPFMSLAAGDWSIARHFRYMMSGLGIYAYILTVCVLWYTIIEGMEASLEVTRVLRSQAVAMALTLFTAMISVYLLTGVGLTVRRCFRGWRRDRADCVKYSSEMVNKGPV